MTPAQLATFKAAILAETASEFIALRTNNDEQGMADWYNTAVSPAIYAWDPQALVDRIHDSIDDTKYTPADAPDGTAAQTNRCLYIAIKQMNLQTMLNGRFTIDATKSNVRTKLKDATTAVPAGTNGANVSPGGGSGVNVLTALRRNAPVSRFEKLFSAGTQTTGTVAGEVLVIEGNATAQNISDALRS